MSDAEFAAWFWGRVDQSAGPDGCWPWMGGRSNRYGRLKFRSGPAAAHRVAHELAKGPVPPYVPGGLEVCHSCHFRPCCNPRHLSLGTRKENVRQTVEAGNHASGDRNGTRLHPERLARGDRHHAVTKPETFLRGEEVSSARLTTDDVHEVRRLYADGHGVVAIATRFGVSHPTISDVLRGRTWRHVPNVQEAS